MKVLLDNCVLSDAEFAEHATKEKENTWGDIRETVVEPGYRKRVFENETHQKEVDALVTVGRLIREGKVEAFTYNELEFESFRRPVTIKAFNALSGCQISRCLAPIERSKFRKTSDLSAYESKGGKEDKRYGDVSRFGQIPFLEWLVQLDALAVQKIVSRRAELGLTSFEVESLEQLDWFKFVCQRVASTENYPDAFHLWTAERNEIDVFLTMERRLSNIVKKNIKQSKTRTHDVKTLVLRPTQFLAFLGIDKLDKSPIEAGKFYPERDVRVGTQS